MLVIDEVFNTQNVFPSVFLTEYIRFQCVQLSLRNGLDAIVETVDQNFARLVTQGVQRFHQVPHGAGHDGRVHRVRVLLAHLRVQLHI